MYDDDDFSDLTDISDDDYVGGPSTKKKSQKKTKDANTAGGFKVKNALKVPRPTTYTVQSLYDQIHGCDINLEPDYQRDVVWPEAKQIGIIDSVFRNFYIPPVIFAVSTFDDGSEARTCIDGKQRLTSIYRFMDGLIPHKDPLTGEKLWYKDVGQSKRPKRLLPEKYRRLFANKQIVCVEYHDITDQDEREIFQRVQLGMALTPAEKLQVVNSPRAQFVRELQLNYLKEEGTGLNTSALDWDRTRGADFRCLAQAVYVIDKYSSTFKTAPTIVQLEKWLLDETTPLPSFKKKITDTFDIFVLLVHEKTMKSVFKKPAKVSPIEFILIVVLIAICKDKMSLSELSAAIGGMRDDVRSYHADIRMNTKVTKTMMDYIRNLKPGKAPPEQTIGYMMANSRQGPTPSSIASKAGDKRKRGNKMEVDDDSDEDSSDEVDELEDDQPEQPTKKAKKPPPAANMASIKTEPIVTKFGPPTRALTSTSTTAPTSQTPSSATTSASTSVPLQPVSLSRPSSRAGDRGPLSPTQPSLPRGPLPRLDRLAGVRAARAAMVNVAPSNLSQLPAPSSSTNAPNGLPPLRIPTAFPSPSLPFSGFKGGLGAPIPSPSFPGPQPTQYPVSPSNPIPLPQNQNLGLSISLNAGQEGENEKREREKREREQWEIERYGRVQRGEQDYGQGSSTIAGGSGKGTWTGGNNFTSDSGWVGRRGQGK